MKVFAYMLPAAALAVFVSASPVMAAQGYEGLIAGDNAPAVSAYGYNTYSGRTAGSSAAFPIFRQGMDKWRAEVKKEHDARREVQMTEIKKTYGGGRDGVASPYKPLPVYEVGSVPRDGATTSPVVVNERGLVAVEVPRNGATTSPVYPSDRGGVRVETPSYMATTSPVYGRDTVRVEQPQTAYKPYSPDGTRDSIYTAPAATAPRVETRGSATPGRWLPNEHLNGIR